MKDNKFSGAELLPKTSELLRKKNETVDPTSDEIKNLVEIMFEKMYEWKGIGLAAPQMGVNKRVAVVDVGKGEKFALINPEITFQSKQTSSMDEGCLNFPEEFYPINRPKKVRIKYYDLEGNLVKQKASGLLAKAFQHEVDHLNKILIVDRAHEA